MPESHDFLSIDLSIDASIIAQQLTLIAADLYNEITLAECEAWQSLSPHGPTPPHINAVIRHSNKVQTWVLRTLESSTKQESQTAQVASHIIAIANGCLALNNFSTLFSVVTALNEESVQQSLESINTRARLRLMHLQEVVSPKRGFWCYRQAIRTALLPCVPFLGIALTDLSFIEEGTPKSKPDVKRQKTAEVWGSIERFQSERYQFNKNPDVQKLVRAWIELSDPEGIEHVI